jgi:hypothetical protein
MVKTMDQAGERPGSAVMFQPMPERCGTKKNSKSLEEFCFSSNPFVPSPELCAPGTKNGLKMLVDFMDFLAKDPKAAEAFLDVASKLMDEFGNGAEKPLCNKPPMFAVK